MDKYVPCFLCKGSPTCFLCSGEGGWIEAIEEPGDYRVEPMKEKGKDLWVVIRPDGEIANGLKMTDKKQAEKYRDICQAHFGARNGN